MQRSTSRTLLVVTALASTTVLFAACAGLMGSGSPMGFFVTSVGSGKGGDLGGLAGADAHCQNLATAAGAGGKTWRAYLSAQPANGAAGVNARDRIGSGPWQNAKGVTIATDVENLHANNALTKMTALNERGEGVNGRGDTPNVHDVLTGSQPDGRFIPGTADSTCRNWTLSDQGAGMVGHHDRTGLDESAPAKSWNSSHLSRGCSQDQLKASGGAGLFYCFAVK